MSGNKWKIAAISTAAIVIVVGLFFILEYRPEAAKLDPRAALKDGLDAFNNLSVTGRQRITVYRNGKPAFSEEIKSPIEPLLIAQAMEPRDEKARRKLEVYRRLKEISADFRFKGDFLEHHEILVNGSARVAGRKAWEIEIRPTTVEGGFLKIFLDSETGYPLKRVKYDRKGMKENSLEFIEVQAVEKKREGFGQDFFRPDQPAAPEGNRPFREGPDAERPHPRHPPPFNPPAGERPEGGGGPFMPDLPRDMQGRPRFNRPFIPADVFFKEHVSQGKVLFPTYIPEGYHFFGSIKLPLPPEGNAGRVHMIFTDGVNNLSIFQIKLPPGSMHSGEAREFLRRKAGEFLNSYPEGVALRKVDDGLIVGIGDLAPEEIEKVIGSMVMFEGEEPAQ